MIKVFTFVKPLYKTLMSDYLSSLIAETLKCPLVWDAKVHETPLDLLIVVNGPYAFCSHLPALAKAVLQAKRIAWVQHDYTVVPPKVTSKGLSPFRACWRLRHKRKLPDMALWTTIPSMLKDGTFTGSYVNWNAMAYQPLPPDKIAYARARAAKDLLYYGAYRINREIYFHRYFDNCPVPLTLSGERPQWKAKWPNVNHLRAIPRTSFYDELAKHGLGLYIEDRKSHKIFTSPASRFYEMLSAGLPMVFQPEAAPMLLEAGIDVAPYVVRNPFDLVSLMKKRNAIGEEQNAAWTKDHYGMLVKHIRAAYRKEIAQL